MALPIVASDGVAGARPTNHREPTTARLARGLDESYLSSLVGINCSLDAFLKWTTIVHGQTIVCRISLSLTSLAFYFTRWSVCPISRLAFLIGYRLSGATELYQV